MSLLSSIGFQIAYMFSQNISSLLFAIIMLCLAIFNSQLVLSEKVNKKQDEPQAPPQRNLQGELIARKKKKISVTNDDLVEMAQSVLREIDTYRLVNRTDEQLLDTRDKARDLLNATITHRRQCNEAANELLKQQTK